MSNAACPGQNRIDFKVMLIRGDDEGEGQLAACGAACTRVSVYEGRSRGREGRALT